MGSFSLLFEYSLCPYLVRRVHSAHLKEVVRVVTEICAVINTPFRERVGYTYQEMNLPVSRF